MAKLIQLSPDKGRRRALKKAGHKPADADSGQLDLFGGYTREAAIQPIMAFADPFVKGLFLHEQNHPQAKTAYLEAIAREKHVADSYCNLAIIYAAEGDDLKAMETLSRAIVEEPRHAESHYNLANLYLDHGDLRLSRLHYELAIRFYPDFPEAYLVRNERKKAVEMLAKYEELVPGGLEEIEEVLQTRF